MHAYVFEEHCTVSKGEAIIHRVASIQSSVHSDCRTNKSGSLALHSLCSYSSPET